MPLNTIFSSRARRVSALAVLLCAGGIGNAQAAGDKPQQVVGRFLQMHLKQKTDGLPTGSAAAEHDAFLSAPLRQALASAQSYETEVQRRFPGQPTGLPEGDLFSSALQGATEYTLESEKIVGDRAVVTVNATYSTADKPAPICWQDRFELIRDNASWRIDDVRYGGGFDVGNTGDLKQNLLALKTETLWTQALCDQASAPAIGHWIEQFVDDQRARTGHRTATEDSSARVAACALQSANASAPQAMLFVVKGLQAGGNDWQQYLAIFSDGDTQSPRAMKVADSNGTRFAGLRFDGNAVTLIGKHAQAGDPPCCPTQEFTRRIPLAQEVKHASR